MPRHIGTLAIEPTRHGDGVTYRVWLREPGGWSCYKDGWSARDACLFVAIVFGAVNAPADA
jgi:hypothetical protein